MDAVRVHAHGGPEVLQVEDVADPVAGAGELLIEVAAAGVNFIDIYQRTGAYPMDLPYVVGSEGAGTVIAVGEAGDDVESPDQWAVGDRVAWAMVGGTGAAQVVSVPGERAIRIPQGVSFEQAAAVMLQGMTAHYLAESTFTAHEGHTALVHAAAGGVGLLLTQWLSGKGVRVIGTASTKDKAGLAMGAGADAVVLYRDEDLIDRVRELTEGVGVDVVYDGIGKDTFESGLALLKPRGTMALFGAASGPVPPLDPQMLNAKGSLFLTRPSLAHYVADREELQWRAGEVLEAVASGTLGVRIGQRYALAELGQAHRDLEAGRTTGKSILTLSETPA
ncbi:quinone oxidoreductase [Ornithinimicrobium sp. Arc0846-15]|nr:quinone oxidoreductase [Ornithinimicrobium laminariae]